MLNGIWAAMILIGIVWAAWHGTMAEVGTFALKSAGEAVDLCITMAGVMALWSGLMEVAKDAGILKIITKKMQPVLHFLFPRIPREHPALEAISTNFTANLLGLGWAATPAGLKAMEALKQLEEERRKEDEGKSRVKRYLRGMPPGIASNEMCIFLIINISSLQLIPVNLIAYRSQYGSVNPAAIVGPGFAATAVSTAAAVLFCKVMDGRRK